MKEISQNQRRMGKSQAQAVVFMQNCIYDIQQLRQRLKFLRNFPFIGHNSAAEHLKLKSDVPQHP